ncbi:MAG: hypothetical protein ACOYM3_29670 [Terrimicrobiaceae bacterium]
MSSRRSLMEPPVVTPWAWESGDAFHLSKRFKSSMSESTSKGAAKKKIRESKNGFVKYL